MEKERFYCVEILSGKSEPTWHTRWGAHNACHRLNKWYPNERWVVKSYGVKYTPNYNEQRRSIC